MPSSGSLAGQCPRCLVGLGLEVEEQPSVRPAILSVVRSAGRAARAALLPGPEPAFVTDTERLLRHRLRLGALMIICGVGLFLARDLLRHDQPFTVVPRVVLLAFDGVAALLLFSSRPLRLRELRLLEIALIGLVAGWFAHDRYRYTLLAARGEEPGDVLFAVAFSVLTYFAFLTAYAIFVPSTWRRAAAVIGALAACPAGVLLVLAWRHPAEAARVGAVITAPQATSMALMLVIGVLMGVAGTHRIAVLRQEAFEARELGQYRLRRRIGGGGMGEVWEAEHRLLARPAAVKLIRPGMVGDDDPQRSRTVIRLFEEEARATASLRSVHTVELYDFGVTEDGIFYYVMELLDGFDLETLVRRHGPVEPARAVAFLRQACDSLAEAHGLGLVHRDVKPANLFVCRLGTSYDFVKVLDFGLARLGELGEGVLQAGTPGFMAPELRAGAREVDGRADVFALGGVAWWLLTGAPPGRGALEAPPALQRVVDSCLAADPAARPAGAADLAARLEALRVEPPWTPARARQWWEERVAVAADRPTRLPSTGEPTRGRGAD